MIEFTWKQKCQENFPNIEFEGKRLWKKSTLYNPTNSRGKLRNFINSIGNTKGIKLFNESDLSKEEQDTVTKLTNNPNNVIQKLVK